MNHSSIKVIGNQDINIRKWIICKKGCLLPLQIILLKQIEGKFSAEQTLKEFTNTQLKNIMKISLFAANILCQ